MRNKNQLESLIIVICCLIALSILLNIGFITKSIVVKGNCEIGGK